MISKAGAGAGYTAEQTSFQPIPRSTWIYEKKSGLSITSVRKRKREGGKERERVVAMSLK